MPAEYYRRPCPCWRQIYVRDIGQYRNVTDPHCPHCQGTGTATYFRATTARNVRGSADPGRQLLTRGRPS